MISPRLTKKIQHQYHLYDVLIGISLFISSVLVGFHKIGFSIKSLSYPLFFYGDEFFTANLVATLIRKQSLINDEFGWPLGQDFSYALVSQDLVPQIMAALLGGPANNPYLGLNLYFLLTFGLTSIGFYVAARILGVSRVVASCLALGTSFLPHHYSTSTQAITVISYFFLPILLAVFAVQIRDRHTPENFSLKKKTQIYWFAFCMFSGTIYSYYSIGMIVIVGSLIALYTIFDGNFNAIKSTILGLIGILVGFIIVAIPSLSRASNTFGGINYFEGRSWQAAFPNSGSLVQSLAPAYNSLTYRIFKVVHPEWNSTFETFNAQLASYGIFAEGTGSYIGLPIIILVLLSFYTLARIGNFQRIGIKNKQRTLAGKDLSKNKQLALAGQDLSKNKQLALGGKDLSLAIIFCWLAILSLLWSWGGGLGQFFAMFVSQSLRAYARFYVYSVISLALCAAVLLTLIFNSRQKNFLTQKVMLGTLALVFMLDGIPLAMYQQPQSTQVSVNEIKAMTEKFPKNCAILQFPVVHFPYESPGWSAYALMAPGILTDRSDLRWSSGAVGGSKAYAFLSKYRDYQDQPDKRLLEVAKKDGYCGMLIDKNVWDTFHGFTAGENYKRVPASELTDFLSTLGPFKKFILSSNTYYFAKL
jgi:hypothetical protein